MYIGLRVKYRLVLSACNGNWIFVERFSKKHWNIKFYEKSVQWERSCFTWTDGQAGRQTDMTKLIDALRNSANASKNLLSAETWYFCHWNHSFCCSLDSTAQGDSTTAPSPRPLNPTTPLGCTVEKSPRPTCWEQPPRCVLYILSPFVCTVTSTEHMHRVTSICG